MPDTHSGVQLLLVVSTGLGLAAACGFRVFVPLLVASLGARGDHVRLHEDFAWLASTPALVVLIVATVAEVAAYYVPLLDNLLDTIATPAAAVAGAVVALSVLVDVDPWLRWSLGLVAGAGLATAVQIPTAALRGGSTVTTGGTANAGVSTSEAIGASVVSGLAVIAPIAIPMVLLAVVVGIVQMRRRRAAPGSAADRR